MDVQFSLKLSAFLLLTFSHNIKYDLNTIHADKAIGPEDVSQLEKTALLLHKISGICTVVWQHHKQTSLLIGCYQCCTVSVWLCVVFCFFLQGAARTGTKNKRFGHTDTASVTGRLGLLAWFIFYSQVFKIKTKTQESASDRLWTLWKVSLDQKLLGILKRLRLIYTNIESINIYSVNDVKNLKAGEACAYFWDQRDKLDWQTFANLSLCYRFLVCTEDGHVSHEREPRGLTGFILSHVLKWLQLL